MLIKDFFAGAKYRYNLRVVFSKASLEDLEKAHDIFLEEYIRAKLHKLKTKQVK